MSSFYRMNVFFHSEIFLAELIFLKGDRNTYFKEITLFKKKIAEKNKIVVKIINIFFLKI